MSKLKSYLLILVATVPLTLMPVAAQAQILTCNTVSGTVAGGQLYPTAGAGGACEFSGVNHIFSWIVCDYVGILNAVIGQTYCGLQYSLQPALAALLTLYIAIFGVQVLMGRTRLHGGEIVVHLVKVAAVWVFATEAVFGISLIFEFFLGLIGDGSAWVINAAMPGTVTDTDTVPIYDVLDNFIYQAILGAANNANANVIGFFAVMGVIYTPIFALAAFWLMTTLAMLARTISGFLLGISAIAFLISLSPLFLSCMLFRVTYHLFESWLRYMASYSIQIIISFAIAAMWIVVTANFIGFFNDVGQMIYPYQKIVRDNGVDKPSDTWAICKAQYSISATGAPTALCTSTAYADLIPPSAMWEKAQKFFVYVIYNLLVLCLIGYAFLTLIHKAPNIAHDLVGPEQVPVIGQGWGQVGLGEINQGIKNVMGRGEGTSNARSRIQGIREAIRGFAGQADIRERMSVMLNRNNITPGK